MSKLAEKATNSKLNIDLQEEIKENVLKPVKHKIYPRSYIFSPELTDILKHTLDRVNDVSPKKIGEARLVRALIWLSQDINEQKLLQAVKEVW